MTKVDFLRHIVNYVLAQKMDVVKQVADDVRKIVEKAENKYNFSAFGGDVKKLVDYLRSPDFDELAKLLKDAGKLDVLEEILKIAREKYKDIPEIVGAIDARLKTIAKAKLEVKEVEEAYKEITRIVGDRAIVERIGNTINVNIRGVGTVIVSYDPVDKSYSLEVEVSTSKKKVGLETIKAIIEALLLIRG